MPSSSSREDEEGNLSSTSLQERAERAGNWSSSPTLILTIRYAAPGGAGGIDGRPPTVWRLSSRDPPDMQGETSGDTRTRQEMAATREELRPFTLTRVLQSGKINEF